MMQAFLLFLYIFLYVMLGAVFAEFIFQKNKEAGGTVGPYYKAAYAVLVVLWPFWSVFLMLKIYFFMDTKGK